MPYRPLSLKHSRIAHQNFIKAPASGGPRVTPASVQLQDAASKWASIRGHVQHSLAPMAEADRLNGQLENLKAGLSQRLQSPAAPPNVQPLPPHAVEGPQTSPIANMAKNVATTKGTDHKWPVRSAREVLGAPSPRRTAVTSGNIKSIGWRDGVLSVRFHDPDAIYVFEGVPPALYEKLMAAPSHNRFFQANIRGKFPTLKHAV